MIRSIAQSAVSSLARSMLGGETSLWTPANISSAWWLDAADPSTVTLNGSTVAQWNDKSGNGRNVTQGTATAQPTYSATGFNSRPTIATDGGDFLTGSTNQGGLLRNAAGGMVFMVGEHNGGTAGAWYFVSHASAGSTRALFQNQTLSRFGLAGRRLDADALGSGVVATTMSSGQQFISMAHFDYANAQISHYLNGTADFGPTAFQTAGSTSDTASGGASIFSNFGGTNLQPANAKLSEFILINYTLPANDRQKVEGYLAWKWGLQGNLPVGHPYKTDQPTI